MADYGHNYTEKQLEVLEKRFQSVYRQAEREVHDKLMDYLHKFKAKDEAQRKLLEAGKITEAEYTKWRYGQMMIGKRWKEMRDGLAQEYTDANGMAMRALKHQMPDVFAENVNYSTYDIEQMAGVDTSFTLYDRQTVDRLLRDNPELLPQPQVDIPADLRWNRQKIQSAIEQGVLQGESIPNIAKRLQKVTGMNQSAAVRNARTAMTSAQNGGRIESYHRAQGLGINMKKCWLATMDNRVRHEHAALDGETAEVDEPFEIAGVKIKFPGDSSAPGFMVWNCRCTLIPQLKGFEHDVSQGRFSRLENMSYDEWKEYHESKQYKKNTIENQIKRARTVSEINDIMNSQGWFRTSTRTKTSNLRYDRDKMKWVWDTETITERSIADLTGCDLDSAKSIATSYRSIFDRYPQLAGKFDAPDAQPVNMGNSYAWCHIQSGGKVQVNPLYFGDHNKLQEMWKNDIKYGFHPQGTTSDSIVTHEIGHAIDGLISQQGILGGTTKNGKFRYGSTTLRSRVMKKCGLDIDDTVSEVSVYATENAQEWFAECFAEYMTSPNPRKVAKEFGKQLEELIGGIK